MIQYIQKRSNVLFNEQNRLVHQRTDRMFALLMMAQGLLAILFSIFVTPTTWSGEQSSLHIHVYAAFLIGIPLALFPVFLVWQRPGEKINRHVIAIAQMGFSALFVHLTGGRIETHFHIFGSLAFLAFYRDRNVLLTATLMTTLDHFLRGVFWPASVYGVDIVSAWRTLEHAAWVIFEDIFLFYSINQSQVQTKLVAAHQAELENTLHLVEEKVRQRTAELTASQELVLAQQETLVVSAKNSALGEMAGQIAHEINTPLAAIVLTAQGLAKKAKSLEATDAEVSAKMDFILQVTHKMTRIIGSMRKLAGHGAAEQMQDVDIKSMVDDILLLCEGRLKKNGIQFTLENRLPEQAKLYCRANEIGQILVNLLNNANDAAVTYSEKWIRLEILQRQGWIIFRVIDSGRGLTSAVEKKLFSPQFTTKTLDHGTGFGLSISKRLVEQHKGRIYFDPKALNTTFTVEIPASEQNELRVAG